MRIGITSDLHGYLSEIEPCDILCICGDICPTTNHGLEFQKRWLENDFKNWCNNLPTTYNVFIAGNHDFIFEKEDIKNIINPMDFKTIYLNNKLVSLYLKDQTIKIYGTPYCKQFGNWAFMESNEKLEEIYSQIPDDVDILLTHDAPTLNDCGIIYEEGTWNKGVNAGNAILSQHILKKKPKYAFCGHIHSGNHKMSYIEGTKVVNVSIMNEQYEPVYPVRYINL